MFERVFSGIAFTLFGSHAFDGMSLVRSSITPALRVCPVGKYIFYDLKIPENSDTMHLHPNNRRVETEKLRLDNI